MSCHNNSGCSPSGYPTANNECCTDVASYTRFAYSSAQSAYSNYNSMQKLYLGAKASDPTTDNQGNALEIGASYYNTTSGVVKVWTGSIWDILVRQNGDQDVLMDDISVKSITGTDAPLNINATGLQINSSTTNEIGSNARLKKDLSTTTLIESSRNPADSADVTNRKVAAEHQFYVGATEAARLTSTQLQLRDGTITAPALTNIGDTDTGILFPGTNQMSIVAGGFTNLVATAGGPQIPSASGGYPSIGAIGGVTESISFNDGTSFAYNSNTQFQIQSNGLVWQYQPATAVQNASVTLSAADLSAKIIESTPAALITFTLPNPTTLWGYFVPYGVDLSLDFYVINKAAATNTITITVTSPTTSVGNMVVAVNSSAHFRLKINPTTATVYRL